MIALEAIDQNAPSLDLDSADLFRSNDPIAILQVFGGNHKDAPIGVGKEDLDIVVILLVVRIGGVQLIELAAFVECMTSLRFLLERNPKGWKGRILLEVIEENTILLDGYSRNVRGIHDAISIANVMRRQSDCLVGRAA
jgi:hypothetical protein